MGCPNETLVIQISPEPTRPWALDRDLLVQAARKLRIEQIDVDLVNSALAHPQFGEYMRVLGEMGATARATNVIPNDLFNRYNVLDYQIVHEAKVSSDALRLALEYAREAQIIFAD